MPRRNLSYAVPLTDERKRLAEKHYWLVLKRVVGPWTKRNPDLREEILDAASDGLVRAAQAYPMPNPQPFATFALNGAEWAVRGMIRAKATGPPRLLRLYLGDDETVDPSRRHRESERFDDLVDLLTPDEAAVISLEFGRGYSQKRVGEALGIAQSAVNLRSQNGLSRLRYELKVSA